MNDSYPNRPRFEEWLQKHAMTTFMSDTHQVFEGGTQVVEMLWKLYQLGYSQSIDEITLLNAKLAYAEKLLGARQDIVINFPKRKWFF